MTQPLAQSRRNASVCGCSSMVEQKLPKLLTSAENYHFKSKTRPEKAQGSPWVRFSEQNIWARSAPTERARHHRMEVRCG